MSRSFQFCISYSEIYRDRIVVRQRISALILEITDGLGLGPARQFYSLSGKPIQPAGHVSADAVCRPKDERETPLGHPVAQVSILFDAFDLIVQSSLTDLIKALVLVTA